MKQTFTREEVEKIVNKQADLLAKPIHGDASIEIVRPPNEFHV